MAMSMIEDPSADDVFYPEYDDEPMAESWYQAQAIRTLHLGFERVFAGRADVAVGADNFWYPVRGEPKTVVAPDTMVIVDLPKPFDYVHAGSYRQWEHGGYVMLAAEVLSPSNTWAEMVRKRQFYDRHGVTEYWVIDPHPGRFTLEVWVRDGDHLAAQVVPADGWVSPTTGVRALMTDDGLAVFDPGTDRRWLAPFDEVMRAEAGQADRIRELEARLAELEANAPPG